jgi:hypothetical protein
MALVTELRQTCSHREIVREGALLQRSRLSMSSIMASLVSSTFVDYDVALRAMVREEAVLAALDVPSDGGASVQGNHSPTITVQHYTLPYHNPIITVQHCTPTLPSPYHHSAALYPYPTITLSSQCSIVPLPYHHPTLPSQDSAALLAVQHSTLPCHNNTTLQC